MGDILFLVGDVRSRSTLLSSLLDLYKDIGVTVESNFMLNLLAERSRFNEANDAQQLFEMLKGRDRFANLGLEPSDLASRYLRGNQKGVAAITSCILESYFAGKSLKQRCGW